MKEDDFKSGDRRDGGRPTNGRRDDARPNAAGDFRPRRDDRRPDNDRRETSNRNNNSDSPRPYNRDNREDRRDSDRPRPSFNPDRKPGYSPNRPDRSGPSRFGNNTPNNRREEYPKPKFDRNAGGSSYGKSGQSPRWTPKNTEEKPRFSDTSRESGPRNDDSRADDRPAPRLSRNADSRDERPRSNAEPRQRSGEDRFGKERQYAERPAPKRYGESREERPSRDERPRSFDRNDRPERPNRDERPRSFDRNDRPERPNRDERPRSFDRNDRPERPRRDEQPNRDQNAWSDGKTSATEGDTNESKRTFRPRNDREERPAPRREERRSGPSSEERRVGKFTQAPNYDPDQLRKSIPRRKLEEVERAEKHDNRNTGDGAIRLNRYIANAGICSRREADELIAQGTVQVNGKVVTEMGHKVQPGDVVKYGNRVLNPEKMVYVLLNKPKDYITTTEDPEERRTVMELVADAGPYRIYPVGRLDRNTTGLMLMTNDGELAEKLTHPSNEIKKIYQVELDKPITDEHFEAIQAGIQLEDGPIKPDALSIITPDAQVVGIEIHSGRNRIVRRIFENFGYEVTKLDRTAYAGLSKKDLPRGSWRFLEPKEVVKLKYLQ